MTASVSAGQAADRVPIGGLFDAYASCADWRNAAGQMALFTEDTVCHVFVDGKAARAGYVLHGRDALAPDFAELDQYQATQEGGGSKQFRNTAKSKAPQRGG